THDGRKMGKTAQGAVWLDAAQLSPYAFWQFWRNTADADVGRFLKLFTDMPAAEAERLGALPGGPELNAAKARLASAATALAHGAEAAEAAAETARQVFESGGVGEALPTVAITRAELEGGLTLGQLFQRAGLAKSGKEAKRLFAEGGARVADAAAGDPGLRVAAADFAAGALKLSAGKKRHALVTLEDSPGED
ncbi:MAG: tyrosine--tRNA ligase, partial [Pseudomonadota bacterium]